jgi:NAD(P)-dependent dehydrogenase (short-subunit alcohol dehydrogenase family)
VSRSHPITSSTSVIITGAAGCLGLAVARWWARTAAHLVLIDRDAARLTACGRDMQALGAEVATIVADLATPADMACIPASLPPIAAERPLALILAHGIAGRDPGSTTARLGALDLAAWQRSLDVNLTSIVFTIQAFLPFFSKAGGGRIVLVSSAAGIAASPTAALSYSVAKAAVAALPRLLAPQLSSAQILINAVAPGKFENPAWPDDPAAIDRYARNVPLGRLASADEVAELIGFLSSAANTYVTGQVVVQDGGRLSGLAGDRS